MASQTTINKQCNVLISLFIKMYEEKHRRSPQINRYKQKWGFQDMIADIGYEKSQEVMSYFFGLNKPEHSVQTLLFNYDRYAKILDELAKDKEERRRLREETQRRVEEWDNIGNNGGKRP